MSFRQLKLTRFGILEVIESVFTKGITEMVAAEQTATATYDKATKTVPKIFEENIAFADEEKEIKEVIDVIQPAVAILEKEMGGGASIMVKP